MRKLSQLLILVTTCLKMLQIAHLVTDGSLTTDSCSGESDLKAFLFTGRSRRNKNW